MFKKIIKQTSWQVLGKVVTTVSTLIILSAISRNYGEYGVGIYSLVLVFLALFYLSVDFGFNAHIVPQLVKSDSFIWQKLLGLRLIFGLFLISLCLIVAFVYPTTDENFRKALFIGAFSILGVAIYNTGSAFFQAKLRYDLSVIAVSISTLVSLLLTILLIYLKVEIATLIWAHLLGWLVCAVLVLFFVSKFKKVTPLFDFKFTKDLFLIIWPVSATLILNVVYFRADAFILSYFKGFSDVGIYNLAYQVFQSVLVLPTFIMNSYYPLMITSLENRQKFISQIKMALLGLALLSCLGIIFTFLFSSLIIKVIASEGFVDSARTLNILSFIF